MKPFLTLAPILLASALAAAQERGPFSGMSPGHSASPTLRADTAIYHLDKGVLQYAFVFVNPSDTVLYLDCQVPPKSTLSGNTLVLTFDRTSALDGPDSAGAKPRATAGGPVEGGVVDPKDFPPQRIGPRQTFQGQRKLDRVLGDYHDRPQFAKVQLRMTYYPESGIGKEGRFSADNERRATAKPITVAQRGKAPAPPKAGKPGIPRETPPLKNP